MKSKFTPGPWAWFGNPKHGGFYLATVKHGRKYVMDFVRHGMQGAQPRFQQNGIMENASDLCTFEVCDAKGMICAKKDGQCYRYDIDGIDHPDAQLIAAAPELLEALERLRAAEKAPRKEWISALENADAVIAKAKGETNDPA